MPKPLQSMRLIGLTMAIGMSACGGGGGGGEPASGPPPPNPLYVRSSTGRDTNTGADPGNALKTISRAAQLARSGYTIIVGKGTYRESVTPSSTGVPPQGLSFIADATGDRTGDSPGAVLIDASNTANRAGFKLTNSPGSLIDGFTIVGSADGGIVLKRGDKGGSDDFTIQNCIIHDNPGDGIRVQDSASVLILNNLVYGNGGKGIIIAGSVSGSPSARIFSNTVAANADQGIQIGSTAHASANAVVHNNIIQDNDTIIPQENIKAFANPDSVTGYDGDYNLVFPPAYTPNGLKGPHDFDQTDAKFVAEGSDFHLRSNSPAINGASVLPLTNNQTNILHSRTTTGAGLDTGALDAGFHFLP